MENRFRDLFIEEIERRLLHEGWPRLVRCLELLDDDEIWWRPNDHSNSVGNLVLHLCGNVRQWLISGLGGQPDTRQRQSEFDESGPIPRQLLLEMLAQTMTEAQSVLHGITAEKLLAPVRVQGYDENGISVLVHVVEHFSWHTGQATYFVKWKKDLFTDFYRGQNLDTTNEP
ncbi:MAG: hypothetical protein KatS3mg029_0142 [Saprospiraceae bacterium]|nr:MAG: hypothetical protein KatS3mg029_0142 [Saprospiraceae bacterium]